MPIKAKHMRITKEGDEFNWTTFDESLNQLDAGNCSWVALNHVVNRFAAREVMLKPVSPLPCPQQGCGFPLGHPSWHGAPDNAVRCGVATPLGGCQLLAGHDGLHYAVGTYWSNQPICRCRHKSPGFNVECSLNEGHAGEHTFSISWT